MLGLTLCVWGCTPDSGSILGGNLGDAYYCMPGPPSATFKGTSEVGFCEEEENNGTLISECNDPLYLKKPKTASSTSYTVAKVIPGPYCRPNPDYTKAFIYTNETDTANQNDAEPCNCHNYNIRLAINKGNEDPTQDQSQTVAKKFNFKSDMITKKGSPCSFRSASFAWDHLGDNNFEDATIMAMEGNPQGRVHDMKFDPDGVQFPDTAKHTEAARCDPSTAPTCGNSTTVSINQLINYCFIDTSLGLDKEENRIVTQAQVDKLSDICKSSHVPDSWNNITDPLISECCMLAKIKKTPNGDIDSKVVIRRDILQAAGCRSTANSINNGDGKMHRPEDIIPEGVFQGIINFDSTKPPYNFDYPSELENLERPSMDDPGFNKVCLLPEAYAQLKGAECTLITQHSTSSVAPDKRRLDMPEFMDYRIFSSIFPEEEAVNQPWQAEACIVPQQFVHRQSTEDDLPADDMLRLFGMYPRTNKPIGDEKEPDYRLPLYYHILTNAMLGKTSFELQTTGEIIRVLSTMSPAQYVISGGLIFGRHFWRYDWGDHFGDDYFDKNTLHGRTFYGKACAEKCNPWTPYCQEDVDKTVPPQYCLGGKSFLQTSWCTGVRTENDKNQPGPWKNDASLIDAYILKQGQTKYESLPDKAVLVVTTCAEKYPDSIALAAACVTEASEELVARANTCDGMPTPKDGNPFEGRCVSLAPFFLVRGLLTKVLRGSHPGKECKSSQAPRTNPHLYTEEAQTMPSELYFSQCETSKIGGQDVYVFDTSAPKMTGFVHPLFYESLESRRTSTNKYPQPNSESHPTERFKNGIQPNTFVSAGMHPILDSEGDVAAFYSINDGYYEARALLYPINAFSYAAHQVWDREETYIYDNYCQENQFVGALRDYPGFKMASGADYRFDSSRDGCSDEVKRGRTEAYNFLSSLHDQPGCKKTISTVPQHGTKARSFRVVSPTLYPDYRYSFVKSMLTPGKMAGDILKAVGEGAIAVAAFAGAAFTSGATLTIGLTVLGAVMEVQTAKTIENIMGTSHISIPINPTLGLGHSPGEQLSESNKYSSREHLDLIMKELRTGDSALLEQLSAQVQKVKGLDETRNTGATEFIIAEDAVFLESAELTADHNAALNYINVYGPFTKAVRNAILINASYYENGTFAGNCQHWSKTADGGAYLWANDKVVDVYGNKFQQVVLDRDTRGDEVSGRGESLLPDMMAFPQAYKYEWHPYISRMTPNANYRNRMPTFMNGPFVTEGAETLSDGKWQNAIGAFPSIKIGQSMYCSAMLEKDPVEYDKNNDRFRMFEHETVGGRDDPAIVNRVRFDRITGNVFRLRDKTTKAPVFGQYSADVDGITPELAQRCNLCSMYGSPLEYTPIDPKCVTKDGTPLVYKLGKSKSGGSVTLHDPEFNAMFSHMSSPFQNAIEAEFHSKTFNLTSKNVEDKNIIEGLLGMTLEGKALDASLRTCSGNVQSTPAGVPGICELKKEYFILETDKVGMKCPVQSANYGARCVNPFWINDNRIIWPARSTGFDHKALRPNYCFNAFDKIEDGTAYTPKPADANNDFSGWETPLYDPNSKRYTYCLNDPLGPAQRHDFCRKGGHRGYVGYTVGAWNKVDQICTRPVSGGSRLCVWFPDNPNGLGLQELINSAPTDGLANGEDAMKVKIFIVPISWKVARLVWSFAAVSDLSFFNFNNVPGTEYTPYDKVDEDSRGPFKAQTLAFNKSADLWGRVCNVNLLDAVSAETIMRTAFAVLLDAVERMKGPDGNYVVPIWGEDTPFESGSFNFTTTMQDYEVFPEIVTSPILVREHEIAIESAFGYETVIKTNMFENPTKEIRLPIFVPQSQDYCTIFEVGYPNFEANFVEFRMTRCAEVEPYKRTPIVFSNRDVSGASVQSVVVVDAPVATLFKGDDRFDGFSRELGWTLKVTGATVQNVVFRQTLEENDNTHGVMVGAARTLDSVGAFACGPEKLRCNSIAIHYPGSIANLTENDDADQHPLFACDGGVPQKFETEALALYELGQIEPRRKVYDYIFYNNTSCQNYPSGGLVTGPLSTLRGLCYEQYEDGCRAIACHNGDINNCELRANTTNMADYQFEDCYVLDLGPFTQANTTHAVALSQQAWNDKLSSWSIFDGGKFHDYTTPNDQTLPENGTTFNTNLTSVIWLAKTSQSNTSRVLRCSGKGCPRIGQTGCTEQCGTTTTAFGTYGLIQDWKLNINEADQIRICALANPTLCLDQKFLVTDSGELAYDHANFREGVFALELENRPGLCLSRENMSTPMACNVMDLNQRWTLGDNSRLQSDDPYVCATAYAHELKLFSMPCFPCQVSETALRPCTEEQPMHIFASDSPPSWLASENSIGVPVSETHSVAIQLYTGACSMLGTHTFKRCRPECAGPNDLVCDAPLGVGIAMCEKAQSRGPLIAIRGNNINLIFSSVPKLFNVTGTTTKSVALLISFNESVVVYQSDSTFIEDEPLVLEPSIDGPVYASVAKVIFQPIDELGDFQTSSVTMVNVSDIIERFGANVINNFFEQFEESPLLWQVLVAVLTAVLFSLIVLHIVLGYREQKRIADNLAKLKPD